MPIIETQKNAKFLEWLEDKFGKFYRRFEGEKPIFLVKNNGGIIDSRINEFIQKALKDNAYDFSSTEKFNLELELVKIWFKKQFQRIFVHEKRSVEEGSKIIYELTYDYLKSKPKLGPRNALQDILINYILLWQENNCRLSIVDTDFGKTYLNCYKNTDLSSYNSTCPMTAGFNLQKAYFTYSISMQNFAFYQVNFAKARFFDMEFTNVTFVQCDFSETIGAVDFTHVKFFDCNFKLTGLKADALAEFIPNGQLRLRLNREFASIYQSEPAEIRNFSKKMYEFIHDFLNRPLLSADEKGAALETYIVAWKKYNCKLSLKDTSYGHLFDAKTINEASQSLPMTAGFNLERATINFWSCEMAYYAVNFNQACFNDGVFLFTIFERCNLSNISGSGDFSHAQFKHCNLAQANLASAKCDEMLIENCNAEGLQLKQKNLCCLLRNKSKSTSLICQTDNKNLLNDQHFFQTKSKKNSQDTAASELKLSQ